MIETLPEIGYEMVNPEKARAWLASSPGNRRMRADKVARYAEDMRAGKFYTGNDAALFDQKNRLRNFHHRAQAVILSGATIRALVRRNVPDHEIPAIDQGGVRDVVDATSFVDQFSPMTKLDAATVDMALHQGGRKRHTLSNEAKAHKIEKHREALDFILKTCFQNKRVTGITIGPVLAVILRAYYHTTQDKIRYICKSLQDAWETFSDGSADRPAGSKSLYTLREYLLQSKSHDGASRQEIYNKCENMISAFLKGEDRLAAKEKKDEQFPIDDDNMDTVATFSASEVADSAFSVHLTSALKQLRKEEFFSPADIARLVIQLGYTTPSPNPVKSIATRFSKFMANQKHEFKVDGVGIVRPYTKKAEAKRVRQYVLAQF